MADIPQEAITAAAKALAHFVDGTEHEPYPEPDTEDIQWAVAALEAAAPALAEFVAGKIAAHRDAYGPQRLGMGAWRRHLSIAVQVAGLAFMTEGDKMRAAAEALARGDYVACRAPEDEHGEPDRAGQTPRQNR